MHIAYYSEGSGLKYAVENGGNWQISLIDEGEGTGLYCRLVLDREGSPHIAYWDSRGWVKYAHRSGQSWEIETVDNCAGRCTLSLDPEGNPYLLYEGASPRGYLKLAFLRENLWSILSLDSSGAYMASAIGADNYLHVAYCTSNGNQLR